MNVCTSWCALYAPKDNAVPRVRLRSGPGVSRRYEGVMDRVDGLPPMGIYTLLAGEPCVGGQEEKP